MADECGWLIEDRSNGDHSLYMALVAEEFGRYIVQQRRTLEVFKYASPLRFTRDSTEAIRFSRKEDAEAFVKVFRRFMLCPEVIEHMWCEA